MRRKITKQRLTDSCQAGTVGATYSDFQKPAFAHTVSLCVLYSEYVALVGWFV